MLNGFKGNRAYLNDPAEGSYSVPMETFDESFTGICLLFEPGEGFEPGGRQKRMVDFARSRMKGAGAAIAFTVLAAVVSSAFGMIHPSFSRFFLDRLLTPENPEWFLPFLAVLTLVTFVQIAIALARASASLRIDGKMEVCGAGAYMWKVLRLPMEFFSQRMADDIQQRQSANAAVTDRIVNGFAPLILQPFLMVFYLAVMIRYSWLLTLVGVASVFINLPKQRCRMEEIRRDIYLNRLIERKENGLIKVITGIRRCGKSYLLFHIYYRYLLSLGVRPERIITISLDDEDYTEFRDSKKLNSYIKSKISDDGIWYVFLDEVQFCHGFENVLNGLNRRENLDLYVTGSNSRFLSSDFIP